MSNIILPHSDLPGMETDETIGGGWSYWHWLAAVSFAVLVAPAWVWIASSIDPDIHRLSSVTGCLLIGAVLVSAYTDLRWRLIPNWVTYPTILCGLTINGFDTMTNYRWSDWLGTVGFVDSFLGFAALFFGLLMIISYSGGGAGDVKLVGAIGALLGFVRGSEAVLLSFLCCAMFAVIWALLRMGLLKIISAVLRKIGCYFFPALVNAPDPDQKQLLKSQMPLGPFFAMGTLLVLLRDLLQSDAQPFGFLIFG